MTALGKYEILEEIGRGGFGVVYRAVDTTLNRRPVALKVLAPHLLFDPQAVARFHQEAGFAANLHHPNIVVIYEIGEDQGQQYLAMQLVEGKSLADVLKESGPLPLERANNILGQLANALDYAHAQGVLHRDIKPSNILVGKDDHVTLTDFGLARAMETSGLTTSGQMMGTPIYMAPEQLDAVAPKTVDARTDIYALGVVVYEMLAGRPPFVGSTPAVVAAHIQTPPPPISSFDPKVPETISKTALKALAKDPDQRYASANEFANAFDIAKSRVIVPREDHKPAQNAKEMDRRNAGWKTSVFIAGGVGTLLLIVLLAFGFVMMFMKRPSDNLALLMTATPKPTELPTLPTALINEIPTESVLNSLPTIAPTAKVTPTISATTTVAMASVTPTQVAAPTMTPENAKLTYPAQLLHCSNGQTVPPPLTLSWDFSPQLKVDEQFEILGGRALNSSSNGSGWTLIEKHSVTWTRDRSYLFNIRKGYFGSSTYTWIPNWVTETGDYALVVKVILTKDGRWISDLSPESNTCYFKGNAYPD